MPVALPERRGKPQAIGNKYHVQTTRALRVVCCGVLEDIAEGVYRLEAYLTLAGERRPWVITNPVYVMRAGTEGNAAGKWGSATVGPFRKET